MKKSAAFFLTIFIILILLVGCKNPPKPDDDPDNPDTPVIPKIEIVNGNLNFPGISESELNISTLVDSKYTDYDGNISELKSVDSGISQTVFLKDMFGNILGVAYVSGEDISNGSFEIGYTELALGLIKINPYLMVLTGDQETEILKLAQEHPYFEILVSSINNAMIESRKNALDYNIHPEIFQIAMAIGMGAIKSYDDSPTREAYYNLGRKTDFTSTVGDVSECHIGDVSGIRFALVNPEQTFYGVKVNDSDFLLKGRGGFLHRLRRTDPYEQFLDAGDGEFDITFYKGFNSSESSWLNPLKAQGKATYANSIKMFGIFMKIVGLFAPGASNISLTDDQVYSILTLDNRLSDLDLSELASSVSDCSDWKEILTSLLPNYVRTHWKKIVNLIYNDGTEELTEDEGILGQVESYILDFASILPMITQALIAIDAVNEWVPFFYDLVKAPGVLEYEIEQKDGVISGKVVRPEAPSNFVVALVSSSEVCAGWKDNSDDEDEFILEVSEDEFITISQTLTIDSNIISKNIPSLTSSKKYYFRVMASNYRGNSDYSKTVAVRMPSYEGNRFTDMENGTIRDNKTNLIWVKNATIVYDPWFVINGEYLGIPWRWAIGIVSGLSDGEHGITDGSFNKEWRFPTKKEWESFFDYNYSSPVLCNTTGYKK